MQLFAARARQSARLTDSELIFLPVLPILTSFRSHINLIFFTKLKVIFNCEYMYNVCTVQY